MSPQRDTTAHLTSMPIYLEWVDKITIDSYVHAGLIDSAKDERGFDEGRADEDVAMEEHDAGADGNVAQVQVLSEGDHAMAEGALPDEDFAMGEDGKAEGDGVFAERNSTMGNDVPTSPHRIDEARRGTGLTDQRKPATTTTSSMPGVLLEPRDSLDGSNSIKRIRRSQLAASMFKKVGL